MRRSICPCSGAMSSWTSPARAKQYDLARPPATRSTCSIRSRTNNRLPRLPCSWSSLDESRSGWVQCPENQISRHQADDETDRDQQQEYPEGDLELALG